MIRPSSVTVMPPSSSSKRTPNPSPSLNCAPSFPFFSSSSCCNHSPSATLDLILLLLVLFSCAFLLASSLAHIARSLAPLLSLLAAAAAHAAPLSYIAAPILLAVLGSAATYLLFRRWPRRRCLNPRCRGLKKALEFDVQLQTEEALRSGADVDMWKEIDALPWKGGQQGNNPDYECLRVELRKMAPPNGRAVLLFRSRCGCPIAKLEAWGHKRGRRQKKGMQYLALEGGGR